ncbi:BDH1, partial [Symbiodinium sp. CCMP2456]
MQPRIMAILVVLILGITSASGLQEANSSICLSNTGKAYDEYYCGEVGKKRGCIWKAGQCVCENGGQYSKSSHKCWPPAPLTTQAAPTTTTVPVAAHPSQEGNGSVCVSNSGQPYTEYYCDSVGKSRGCIWKDNQCVCANGGYYAKSSHYCWPPESPTRSPTPVPKPASPPAPAGTDVLDYLVAWLPGSHWCAGFIDAFIGACCICALPCTRQHARRWIPRRPALAASQQARQAMLENGG